MTNNKTTTMINENGGKTNYVRSEKNICIHQRKSAWNGNSFHEKYEKSIEIHTLSDPMTQKRFGKVKKRRKNWFWTGKKIEKNNNDKMMLQLLIVGREECVKREANPMLHHCNHCIEPMNGNLTISISRFRLPLSSSNFSPLGSVSN